VGKTTCAATAALALAARDRGRRVLLLSTDPAHSVGDVLDMEVGDQERPVPGARGRLVARELDAERAFTVRRDRYRDAVDEVFDALLGGSRFDVAYDRAVVRQLIDLAPPGLDELFAILAVIEALRPATPDGPARYDTVVVDTAPTGHALRLLQMPVAALEWVHALLAILLKYRKVVALGELAADLLEVARDLRELQTLLHDPARAAFVAVTRAAELPRLETERLLDRLGELAIHVPALIVNHVLTRAGCARCRTVARGEHAAMTALSRSLPEGCAMIVAPALPAPPRGVEALGRWGPTWTIADP
jgi:arsenite-transporting ATPase